LFQGGEDQTVTPSYAQCGIDKINGDFANGGSSSFTVCYDPTAIHGGEVGSGVDVTTAITRRSADWINQFIAAQTLGASPPAPCSPWTGVDPSGNTISCPSLPPNSD
jgi:hypothetical protein